MNDPCPVCARPIEDTSYVCHRCVAHLADDLRRMARSWHEIDIVVARQSVSADVPGAVLRDTTPRGPMCRGMTCDHESCEAIWKARHRALTEAPVAHEDATPANLGASEQGWIIRNTVTSWARHVCETRGVQVPLERPKVLQPVVLHVEHDPPKGRAWCDYGDLPAQVCACGNPNATHPRRTS